MKTFIQLCIDGKAKPEEIDAFIDAWHKKTLWDALGMTRIEYEQWVKNPSCLQAIIDSARVRGRIKTLAAARALPERSPGFGCEVHIIGGQEVRVPKMDLEAQWYESDDIIDFVDEDGLRKRVIYLEKPYKVRVI